MRFCACGGAQMYCTYVVFKVALAARLMVAVPLSLLLD